MRKLALSMVCVVGSLLINSPVDAGLVIFDWGNISSNVWVAPETELFGVGQSGQYPFTEVNGGVGQTVSIDGLPAVLAALGGIPAI